MDLVCPKCQGLMRQYERAGVTVDQCTECRGIFLDRGELERLVDGETRFHGGGGGGGRQSPPPQYNQGYGNQGYGGRQSPPPQYGGHGYGHQQKRKRSFLDDLFD